jgi:flagellar biosynthetic protein FliR
MPWPVGRAIPGSARIGFSLVLTVLLSPFWPVFRPESGVTELVSYSARAFATGLSLSVVFACAGEAIQIGAHLIGVQAGFGYASTIDPSSEADSTVLQVTHALLTGLLFFGLRLDHQIFRLLALSMQEQSLTTSRLSLEVVLKASSQMWIVGVRYALPIVTGLIVIDLALAMFGRLHQQIQLISLSFPVKMLAAVAAIALLTGSASALYRHWTDQLISLLLHSNG